MLRVAILNGNFPNYDKDFSKLLEVLSDGGVISGFQVTTGQVGIGKAFVPVSREGEAFLVYVEDLSVNVIDTTGTKKVWIEIDDDIVQDGDTSGENGYNIASIETGADWPGTPHLKLASISGGVITDAREMATLRQSILERFRDGHCGVSATGNDSYEITTGLSLEEIPLYVPFCVYVDTANTGSCTFEVDGLGAITIKKNGNEDLITGDIVDGMLIILGYDGTYWQLLSPVAGSGSADVSTNKLVDETYYPGQDVAVGEYVYLEQPVAFADATTINPIGINNDTKRWSSPIFGDGVGFTTRKLALRHYGSPGSLTVEIHPDSSGSPSGTPVTNGAVTASSATLGTSTSLQDITVTFPGTVTLTAGAKYHLVVRQAGDTVDASNYYGIGVSTIHSAIRYKKSYNSSWSSNDQVSQATGLSWSTDSNNAQRGVRITANQNSRLTGVTFPSGYTQYTRCQIKDSGGSVLATSTAIHGRTFIFDYALVNGTDYRIELDANGAGINYAYATSGALPAGTYVTYQSGSSEGSDHANMNSVESLQFNGVFPGGMPYIGGSGGILDKLLALTDATYSHKVDFFGAVSSSAVVGTKPVIDLPIQHTVSETLSGQTHGTIKYLSNTPGALANSPGGTYKVKVGSIQGTTGMKFDKRWLYGFAITIPATTVAWQNTTGRPIEVAVDGGTVSAIAISKENTTYRTIHSATGKTVILQPGDYIKLTYSSTPTAMTGYYIE